MSRLQNLISRGRKIILKRNVILENSFINQFYKISDKYNQSFSIGCSEWDIESDSITMEVTLEEIKEQIKQVGVCKTDTYLGKYTPIENLRIPEQEEFKDQIKFQSMMIQKGIASMYFENGGHYIHQRS